MFIRNQFSEAEQKMIRDYLALGEQLSGWVGDRPIDPQDEELNIREITRSVILMIANNHDPKNPLFTDPEYAKASRWGKLQVPPVFGLLCAGAGCGADLTIPPEIGDIRSSQFGEDYYWEKPMFEGDTCLAYHVPHSIEDNTPDGEQEERILTINEETDFYNQNGELCCHTNHLRSKVYVAPGTPDDGMMHAGFGMLHGGRNNLFINNTQWTESYRYTPEQIRYIDEFYRNEPRQGRKMRFWEDVNVGDELPEWIWGPLTEWDMMGSLATHFEQAMGNMNETRKAAKTFSDHPSCGPLFIDPNTNVSYKGVSIHISPDVCKLLGWYSHSISDNTIIPFLLRGVQNWMGDDGFIRSAKWRKFANTTYGDTIIGRSRVVAKYIDEKGRCMVELDSSMETIRGYITNCLPTTVELPSRERITWKREPRDEHWARLDQDPQKLKKWDHVRVKPRGDNWKFPCKYPLEGFTGYINELPVDIGGYVYVIMDEGCCPIDPKAQLGFRADEVERID
jgi:acyl dehydratase